MKLFVNGLLALVLAASHTCGRPKSGGGTDTSCPNARCVKVVADKAGIISGMVGTKDDLVFGGNDVWYVPKTGGKVATLATGRPGWQADQETMYWMDSSMATRNTTIWSAALHGGTPVSIVVPEYPVNDLRVDETSYYWTTVQEDPMDRHYINGAIVRVDRAGGTPVTMLNSPDKVYPRLYQLTPSELILDNGAGPVALPKAGGTPTPLPPFNGNALITEDTIYALNLHEFVKVPRDGSAAITIASDGAGFRLLTWNRVDRFYWSDDITSTLWTATMDGSPAESLLSERGSAVSLVADADRFYWCNGIEQSIKSGVP
jgi:hypothetical protein